MPARAGLVMLSAPLLVEAAHCAERAIDNDDPELIHRFRVSLRQLRCLLWAYDPLLPAGTASFWRTRLGELADISGSAREWAVMSTELAPAMLPEDPAWAQPVLDALARQTRQATDACRRTLLEARPATVLSSLHAAIAQWNGTQSPSPELGAFANRRLRDAYRILRRRAGDPEPTTRALHRTRIAVKRVHYLTTLFAPVLASSAVLRLKSLKRLQLHLGRANDTAAAIAALRRMTPPLRGRHLQRMIHARLVLLDVRYQAQARRTLTRMRKRLKPSAKP